MAVETPAVVMDTGGDEEEEVKANSTSTYVTNVFNLLHPLSALCSDPAAFALRPFPYRCLSLSTLPLMINLLTHDNPMRRFVCRALCLIAQ
jgi:hypothetical protein